MIFLHGVISLPGVESCDKTITKHSYREFCPVCE